MLQNQNWIYTREGDRWVVLPSGILRLEEAPPARLSFWQRIMRWVRAWFRIEYW